MKDIYEHIIAEQKTALATAKDLINQATNTKDNKELLIDAIKIIRNVEGEVAELEDRLFNNGEETAVVVNKEEKK